jgi:DNA-damage-inducible protein D
MKDKYDIKRSEPLADYLPEVTLKAKDLATAMTSHNSEKKDLIGKQPIKHEHIINNLAVRNTLKERNIVPENLPPSQDLKQVEKRYKRKFLK